MKSCRYLQSCVKVGDCPPPKYPEIAVIGRSNVGKSSLINMLTGRTKKEVAKTSKNPGKTQTINHFEMVTGDGTWYLTDLPGYGFANAPEKARKQGRCSRASTCSSAPICHRGDAAHRLHGEAAARWTWSASSFSARTTCPSPWCSPRWTRSAR